MGSYPVYRGVLYILILNNSTKIIFYFRSYTRYMKDAFNFSVIYGIFTFYRGVLSILIINNSTTVIFFQSYTRSLKLFLTFPLSMVWFALCLFMCPFIRRYLHFFGKSFIFHFLFVFVRRILESIDRRVELEFWWKVISFNWIKTVLCLVFWSSNKFWWLEGKFWILSRP